jgi:membrane protein YdbS with pleckstrin-like domain
MDKPVVESSSETEPVDLDADPQSATLAPGPPEGRDPGAKAPEPEPEERASVVDGEYRHVDDRVVFVERVVGIGVTLGVSIAPFIGVGMGWLFGGIPNWLYAWLMAGWLLLFGTITLFCYKWPAVHHRHLTYRVDETGLTIRSGVVWRKVSSVPTTRVQHTDVSQGPLQRRYELATLTVHTAGTQDASVDLAGLEHGVANRLRDHLLPEDRNDAV